ncbi:F-box domain containing protein [Pandoravirus quercus]|uniref:F-box domain containing protein n=1 Tax=Pandoravirus quercus TaxID=2107709 RepID=A0A2U7UA68_9VIRU|nr:F-box domain containing protein [Pandoravirus quercus]AVK75329.1 F-box domain containing protein [Pandoravirus quercus]
MNSGATWATLPDDVILDVMALLPIGDIVALSTTCLSAHALATCASLWRRLFVRDFAHLYRQGLPAQPWPQHDHPDDPWHEIAVDFWRGTDVLTHMPPRCPPLAHLPAPFAHAFAAGKDWRWLYRVHAQTTLPARPDDSFSGPVAYRLNPTTIIRCDWANGKVHGYVSSVTADTDGTNVVRWTECVYGIDDGKELWAVAADADKTEHQASPRGCRGPYLFSFYREGDRRWTTFDASGSGIFTGLCSLGMRYDGEINKAGQVMSLTTHCADGYTIASICNGKVHGIQQSFWHNGDTMSVLHNQGEFVEVTEFVCSPTCPRPEFAGIKIAGCTWRPTSSALAVDGKRYNVFVPIDDSDGARLFWRYVKDGLVGWDPRIRRAVLDAGTAGLA